jgi:hypothetical protein
VPQTKQSMRSILEIAFALLLNISNKSYLY